MAPAQFTVNALTDMHPGSGGVGTGNTGDLRYVLVNANAAGGANSVVFQPGLSGAIQLQAALPNITNNLSINGPVINTVTVNANGHGSVFSIMAGEAVSFAYLTITGGNGGNLAGGIQNNGTATLTNCIISKNVGGANGGVAGGGGIVNSGTMTISDSVVSGNSTARVGGGILNSGTLTITNSRILGNTASDGPGGIWNGGALSINNSTISGNNGGIGGGIQNEAGSTLLMLTNSTFSNNTGEVGGALVNETTTIISNCTIWRNTATAGIGGAIDNLGGTLAVLNSTVSGNTVSGGSGGGIRNAGGAVVLHDTILAANRAISGGVGPDFAGAVSSSVTISGVTYQEGYNLIGSSAGSTGFTNGVNGDRVGTPGSPIIPLLGALQFNGGSTPTLALLPGSPGINAGDPNNVASLPQFDQRGFGFPRAIGNSVDIGAVESTSLAATSNVQNFFHTNGNQIVDSNGRTVRIAGINWFGFETGIYVVHGLWARNWQDMMRQMVQLGFNTIRIPYATDTFNPANHPNAGSINSSLNPDLQGLSSLEILDKIVGYAGEIGLRIILDHHSSIHDNHANEPLWYIPGNPNYTEQVWIDNWVMLARRYAGNATVIGADLHNEPHGEATWGDGNQATDWRAAAQRAGNAILQTNSNWLIFVEGIENYNGQNYWWGGNLMGAGQFPVNLDVADRLVYSVHDYPKSVHDQSWFNSPNFPANLPGVWNQFWAYLYRQNTAPVWVGEFGSKLQTNADHQWYQQISAYFADTTGSAAGGQGISWTWWSWNPDSGDTGGILQDDWKTVNQSKVQGLIPIEFHMPPARNVANTAPIVGGAQSNQSVRENATVAPFAMSTVSDPDRQVLNAVVAITNGVNRGDFTSSSSVGWVRVIRGSDIVYSRSFPSAFNVASAAQSAIRALMFAPRTVALPSDVMETTAFSISISDGIAAPVIDSTSSVVRGGDAQSTAGPALSGGRIGRR